MSLEVMDGDRRDGPRVRQTPAERCAGQKRSGEPRAGGVGNAVDARGPGPRLLKGFLQEGQQLAHVVARGKFGHDPTVEVMQCRLAEKPVGEQALPVVEYGYR